MIQEIYVVDDGNRVTNKLIKLFEKDKGFKFKQIRTEEIDKALIDIPSLILINEDSIKVDIIELCKKIREDDDNSITPMIVLGKSKNKKHIISILKQSVEIYIERPLNKEYIYYIIKNTVRLMYMNRRVSPLTGLPGNVQIQTELKKRISNNEEFDILYFDLDNFKAYNDLYGFTKGDEIIKFTAKTITNNIHKICEDNGFVGHIGGDDFVAIVNKSEAEEICKNVIIEFDAKVQKYFSKEDIENGYLEVENRKGIVEQFPLTSISIGVVEVDQGRFKNSLEIGEVGAQVKHIAKTILGSSYVVDRRKHEE